MARGYLTYAAQGLYQRTIGNASPLAPEMGVPTP